MKFYTGTMDCQWLRDTALRGYDVPEFQAFTIVGNEDCPLEITLYTESNPWLSDKPVAEYELRDAGLHNNLSKYFRRDV